MIQAEIKQDLDFSGFNKTLQDEVNKVLEEIGYYLAKYAQNNHRYKHRTGNLKKSTRYWVDKAKSRVRLYVSEQNADYGKYVHEGHGTWSADRFIDNAILDNIDYINKKMDEAIASAVKKFNAGNRL